MRYEGFIGPAGKVQSPYVDSARTMNWYLGRGPYGPVLYPTPGATVFYTTTDVGCRAISPEIEGRVFAVVGGGFWELFATKTGTRWGAVAQDANPATISYNSISRQVFITAGGNGYLFALATDTLSTIGALASKATMGGMKDGYFLSFAIATRTVYLSALNDGTSWTTGTNYFQRSIAPDPWQAMVVGNPQIWMIGTTTSEAWYDAGVQAGQPFAPILSSFMESGTSAPFSVALAGNGPIWVGQNTDGGAQMVRADGYTPQVISSPAVDSALSELERDSDLTDAETLVYQQDGHAFSCTSFPAANQTWCMDLGDGSWHERGAWNSPLNRFDVWRPRVHAYAFGKHLVGDRSTSVIAELDQTVSTESDGDLIRRVRVAPPIYAASSRERLRVSRLDLLMETGLGLSSGQGSNPLVMLRTSSDARTWSNERTASAGAMGKYGTRVFFTRCGSSRKVWFPEVVCTDPIPWRLLSAEVYGTGMQQQRQAA